MTTEPKSPTQGAVPPVVFSARPFAFAAPFRADADIRYYLNGVAILKHPISGVVIAATNGHQLAVAYDPKGYTDRDRIFTVTKELVRAARKPKAAFIGLKAGRLTVIENLPGLELEAWDDSSVLESFVQVGDPQIEGTFPDVLRVIPPSEELEPGLQGAIASRYSKQAAEAARFVGGPKFSASSHWTWKGNGAIVTRFAPEPNYLVVTMPLRDDCSFDSLPGFLDPMRAARAEQLAREEEMKAADAATAEAQAA